MPIGDTMKYRKLGASDLNVSEISLGSWLTYGRRVARIETFTTKTQKTRSSHLARFASRSQLCDLCVFV
jgi:aryl-alcohol dehydrogenase-like predicted oxidoreductase